jgi:cytochrome c553
MNGLTGTLQEKAAIARAVLIKMVPPEARQEAAQLLDQLEKLANGTETSAEKMDKAMKAHLENMRKELDATYSRMTSIVQGMMNIALAA